MTGVQTCALPISWNNQEETLPPDPPPVQQEVPDEPEKKPDEGLSVRAGNEVDRKSVV